MYIKNFKHTSKKKRLEKKMREDALPEKNTRAEVEKFKLFDAKVGNKNNQNDIPETIPDDNFPDEQFEDAIIQWKAPEFEMLKKNKKNLSYVTLILLAIILYATFSNNPMMAIVFVLIGIVGYMHLNKEPQMMHFRITHEGIFADKKLYPFEKIYSFWILYDPEHKKVISLHTSNYLSPFVHIPIHKENPIEIRQTLLEYIHEEKQDHNIVEMFERFLGV